MKSECLWCFKTLSTDSRYQIYKLVMDADSGLNESQITGLIKLRQPTVSYHLKAMVKSGLLKVENKDKFSYFTINEDCPHDGHRCLLQT